MELKEIRWEGFDWINLAQDKEMAGFYRPGNEIVGALESEGEGRDLFTAFWRKTLLHVVLVREVSP
jgi:hypothetical protein